MTLDLRENPAIWHVSTIGPRFPAPTPPAPATPQAGAQGGPQGAGRSAAQRAFFAAALGQAAPSTAPRPAAQAAPAPKSPPVVHTTRVQSSEIPTGEAPSRILGPGSLVDIRV